jgi:hypothetical protein
VVVKGVRYRYTSVTHNVSIHDARCSLYSKFGVIKAGVWVGAKERKNRKWSCGWSQESYVDAAEDNGNLESAIIHSPNDRRYG